MSNVRPEIDSGCTPLRPLYDKRRIVMQITGMAMLNTPELQGQFSNMKWEWGLKALYKSRNFKYQYLLLLMFQLIPKHTHI